MNVYVWNVETLRDKYCPPIDEALFYAVSSEYQLPEDGEALVKVLNEIKTAADQQDAIDFDPSGTGGTTQSNDPATSAVSISEDDSKSQGVTSVTTGISDLKFSDESTFGDDLENSPIDRKEAWLQKIFPAVDASRIKEVIEHHGGMLNPAIDELLNLAFLSQENEDSSAAPSPVLKGIDGFAEDASSTTRRPRGKRKKNKTNNSIRMSSPDSFSSDAPVQTSNAWETMTDAVEYICSRTSLSIGAVKSAYHAHGARISPTIRAFAVREGAAWQSEGKTNLLMQYQINELKNDFPEVPDAHIYGVFVLARNIPSAAYELLETMTAPDPEPSGKIQGLAQYAPLDLKENVMPNKKTTAFSHDATGLGNVRELAAAHGIAATQAFSQATAAYKKGKSDRLMGGAAAYYSSVGHERMKTARELHSAAADAHVVAQSSINKLDLHGVSVADAVRIANSQVQSWWDSLGDAKYAPGGWTPAHAGYRIVTGVGSHSKNHAPRIGPAVSKMLVREGWKVEIGHGELVVTGKTRR